MLLFGTPAVDQYGYHIEAQKKKQLFDELLKQVIYWN